ncbi:alpha/beta fold hydrolase [Rothia sp. ZJ1223]|uniref:alpha/beta fold hydrolase n=1 Tax=Rothia sp. ZJ1223 TaxID=2811098 RepID=UPI00195848C3|nr:alpha/beta fold hydrolase [Rothia sp. ZJ1223]MBM7050627.1 alpha/beta fold hydrolase [Rothia sp. ZJ1223]
MTAPHLAGATLPAPAHLPGASYTLVGYEVTDHWFTVPLTHGLIFGKDKDAATEHPLAHETITVFAREIVNTDKTLALPPEKRPYMVYLQGGPGFGSPQPLNDGGWVGELSKTHRLVLLDQRGTGNSSPLSVKTLTGRGDTQAQALYAELFRADSIVADAEVVRDFLLKDRNDQRWSTMGQSFGGFLTLSYLSFAPESLKDCRMTAGLAPIRAHVDDVYRHTYARMAERNKEFFEWYPQDAELATHIADHLRKHTEILPTGERLTPHRFQMFGRYLGGNSRVHGLHYALQSAFAEGDDHLSEQFLRAAGDITSFYAQPVYALLHEAIYADGQDSPSPAPTNWSAARVASELPEFAPDAQQLLFTGEHIFPWYFDEDPALTPLHDLAHLLAGKGDWGRLYDHAQLAENQVPLVAAAYEPDVYVDYQHSLKTADFVGNTQVWSSPTHHHDGLSADGVMILRRLENLLANLS